MHAKFNPENNKNYCGCVVKSDAEKYENAAVVVSRGRRCVWESGK
jgi:hypothetical protein